MTMLRIALAFIVLPVVLPAVAAAQTAPAPRFLNPPDVAHIPGVSQAVVIRGGTLVYLAGQVGLDAHGVLVGANDFRAQATQAFENIKTVLAAAGLTPANITKLNYYVVGLDDTKLKVLRDVRDHYINTAEPPASTLAGVQALFRSDCLIEIEAVAVAP